MRYIAKLLQAGCLVSTVETGYLRGAKPPFIFYLPLSFEGEKLKES